jgi:uncharacterized glyoxalase superfamily protein PhnB
MPNLEHRKLVALASVFTVGDAASLHLMPVRQSAPGPGQSTIYVFAANVDELHEELQALGCPIENVPADCAYAMREMSVRDPDGNRITFGQEVKPPDQAAWLWKYATPSPKTPRPPVS